MSNRPDSTMKTEPFDMDSLFDFNQSTTQQSPATASASHNDLLSPFDKNAERQQYNGPSHDYNQYKQQVGLPVGSMVNMPMGQQQMFDSFNSGIDTNMDGFGWNTGIGFDDDMNMDFNNPQSSMPAMFFPEGANGGAAGNFINPNTIDAQEEAAGNVGRLWPGMHSQQARTMATAKAQQAQAMQQRQMKMQAQHARYRQASNASQAPVPTPAQVSMATPAPGQTEKRASHVAEPHVEESISRLLNQMRQRPSGSDEGGSPDDGLPHIARMKKDEDDMDEDERLLNSDEGKKLSSKERRQLRNKVSARAFRSRRKEYISQLEGELAMKSQETNEIRQHNTALVQENERYRGLIETLLRHPAFTPFINDISKDPTVLGMPQQQTQHLQPPAPSQQSSAQQPQQQHQQAPPQQQQQQQPADVKPEYMNFDASQLEIPSQQQQQQQINFAMIPEENFSKLNINNGMRGAVFNNNGGSNFGVNAYAVTGLPPGPDPLHLLASTPAYDFTTPSTSVLLAKLESAAQRT